MDRCDSLPTAGDVLVRSDQPAVVEFRLGDVLTMRRTHPCGGAEWLVDRLGVDIGLRCRRCGRHVLIERRSVERRLTGFVVRGNLAMSLAVAPQPRDSAALDRGPGR
jgi:hypothetical protein